MHCQPEPSLGCSGPKKRLGLHRKTKCETVKASMCLGTRPPPPRSPVIVSSYPPTHGETYQLINPSQKHRCHAPMKSLAQTHAHRHTCNRAPSACPRQHFRGVIQYSVALSLDGRLTKRVAMPANLQHLTFNPRSERLEGFSSSPLLALHDPSP